MQENQVSAENAHTDYPSYLADEQRRKAVATYEAIKERMVKTEEEPTVLEFKVKGF